MQNVYIGGPVSHDHGNSLQFESMEYPPINGFVSAVLCGACESDAATAVYTDITPPELDEPTQIAWLDEQGDLNPLWPRPPVNEISQKALAQMRTWHAAIKDLSTHPSAADQEAEDKERRLRELSCLLRYTNDHEHEGAMIVVSHELATVRIHGQSVGHMPVVNVKGLMPSAALRS